MQPQQQMMPQSIQTPDPSQPSQNQMPQLIQAESQNSFGKCSKCITGSENVPFMVLVILMSFLASTVICFLIRFVDIMFYFFIAALFDFLFALFVWCRLAIKIEKNISTVKYGFLYFINLFILSICTLPFPFHYWDPIYYTIYEIFCGRLGLGCLDKRVLIGCTEIHLFWSFILFETILIALNNRDKKMKFFCCRINGTKVIIFSILYHCLSNWFSIIRVIITVAYAYIYNKYLSQKLNISNERVQRLENTCFIKYFKEKFQTFITLDETQNKDKKQQPLVPPQQQDINNSAMSFVPSNMYPNYYSGIIAAPGQQIQLQQLNPSQGNNIPPVVDINQAN